MKGVIDDDTADIFTDAGCFYIYHRWSSTPADKEGIIRDVQRHINRRLSQKKLVSISIGISQEWNLFIRHLSGNNIHVDFITIDVAHAHHEDVKQIISVIKSYMPTTKLIAGNVATGEACQYLISQGVDAIKVGIGGGRICTTKNKTGFHVPMFSCCLECAAACEKYNIPFIADGGIVELGDIAKALTAGATMVMAGGLFAECVNSPAMIVNGKKEYNGSTSLAIKNGANKHIEGKTLRLDVDGTLTIERRLVEIKEALQSAISYGGGSSLSVFKDVNYISV
jgi:GMP reductase